MRYVEKHIMPHVKYGAECIMLWPASLTRIQQKIVCDIMTT